MSNAQLETAIEAAWDARDTITPATKGDTRDAIEATLAALDSGTLRVAERRDSGEWHDYMPNGQRIRGRVDFNQLPPGHYRMVSAD